MPSNKLTATIKDIGTDYYSGRKIINAQMFIFFEPYFREPNRLIGHEGDYTRTVLKTIISNAKCRQLMLENTSFYVEIVKTAGDDAENFKTLIKDLSQSQPSEELNEFVQQIGVFDNNESSK
jgi:hypothetical protein